MLFTLAEIFDAIALTIVVGWIFKDMFNAQSAKTPEDFINGAKNVFLQKDAWIFASLLVAPSIILHELGHKFFALAYGLDATFQAAWMWVGIAVLMKLFAGFVFFVPAFVSISGIAAPWVFAMAALMGPLINFALYFIGRYAPQVRNNIRGKHITKKEFLYWQSFAKINLFLGCFNLIPIPGFDGYQVLKYVLQLF